MNKKIEDAILGITEAGCQVRAWIKSEGIILRVRQKGFEKFILINSNTGKILANC